MDENSQNKCRIQFKKLPDQSGDFDLKAATPAERLSVMWQLSLDAWAFRGEPTAEPQLQRHIIRVFRRKS